jgi:hypothetical protein
VNDRGAPFSASLTVPAHADMISTVRVFVERAVSSRATEDALGDLRVAVAEACASMRGSRLHVALEIVDGRCLVHCRGVLPPGESDDDRMRARLLGALAPDAEWLPGDEVRFSLPLSG